MHANRDAREHVWPAPGSPERLFANGRYSSLAEVFINVPGRAGNAIKAVARDAAVVASIALQYGAPAETVRRALPRNADGSASGPLGEVLDLVATSEVGRD